MRIRSIKPEFFCDEILDELPADVRLAYAGLWCYCDDAGRGLDDRWLIKAAIAPRRERDSPQVVEKWLEALAAAGRIIRYEIEERRYLQIVRWEHQKISRPTPSRYPPPPLTEDSLRTHGVVTEDSSRAREDLEQGTGNREQGSDVPPAPQDGFDVWWGQYPERNGKKLDKGKTLAAWQRLGQTQRSSALRGVAHYRTACDEGLTIAKDPLRWLQGRCWTDWQDPAQPPTPPPSGPGPSSANGANGHDLVAVRAKLTGYLAASVVEEIEGSLASTGSVTPRRLVGVAKARGRQMQPPIHIPEIEEL